MTIIAEVLADPAVIKWPLKSLTIGPLAQGDSWWCRCALELILSFPFGDRQPTGFSRAELLQDTDWIPSRLLEEGGSTVSPTKTITKTLGRGTLGHYAVPHQVARRREGLFFQRNT